MGENAEMILDGLLCESCGVLIDGESPGHPRKCVSCGEADIDQRCGKPAAFDYIWGPQQTGSTCIDHAEQLQKIAKVMGHYVHLEPVEHGSCTQIVRNP